MEQPLTEQPLTEQPLTEQPLTEQLLTEQPLTEKDIKKLCEDGEYETCRNLAKQAFRDAVEARHTFPLLDLERLCLNTLKHNRSRYKNVSGKRYNEELIPTFEHLCRSFGNVNTSEPASFPQNAKIIKAAEDYIDKYMVKPTV